MATRGDIRAGKLFSIERGDLAVSDALSCEHCTEARLSPLDLTMTPQLGRPIFPRGLSFLLLLLGGALSAASPTRPFDIPAGDADKTLQSFAAQSGVEVLFSTAAAKGVRTNAVRGNFVVEDAVRRMLSGTPLYLVSDTKNGVLRIARAPDPNAPRAAQKMTCRRPEKTIPVHLPDRPRET